MLVGFIIFLFVLFCILGSSKYGKLEYELTKKEEKEYLKKRKRLSKKVVILKLIVYSLLFLTVMINHFFNPLSKSSGASGFLILLMSMSVFQIICILDFIKVRRLKDESK